MPTDQEMKEAFERYFQKPVSGRVFGEWVGIGREAALRALRGETYQHITRPEGFAYVRMTARIGSSRKITPEQVEEGLRLYVKNDWDPTNLANHLGVKPRTAYAILRGQYFKEAVRPEGVVLRTYGKRRLRPRVPELLQLAIDNDWNARQLAEYAGCGETAASNLLRGKTYTYILTPMKSKD